MRGNWRVLAVMILVVAVMGALAGCLGADVKLRNLTTAQTAVYNGATRRAGSPG